MVLVDRARRPCPLEQRAGIDSDVAAVGSLYEVRHQAVRMQLRIALPARAVHEPRHRPTPGAHPATHLLRLHPSHRSAFLEEPESHLCCLSMGRGHRIGDGLRAERP